jgi:hypothetical protein
MPASSRLYHCCRCHAQVIICSRCDRGQRYCAGECRHEARAVSLKRAGKKYQSTRSGSFNNAARQSRYREKNKQKVTHLGSAQKRLHYLLKIRLTETKKTQTRPLPDTAYCCHYCGGACEPFFRQDFLHRHRFKSSLRRF